MITLYLYLPSSTVVKARIDRYYNTHNLDFQNIGKPKVRQTTSPKVEILHNTVSFFKTTNKPKSVSKGHHGSRST